MEILALSFIFNFSLYQISSSVQNLRAIAIWNSSNPSEQNWIPVSVSFLKIQSSLTPNPLRIGLILKKESWIYMYYLQRSYL